MTTTAPEAQEARTARFAAATVPGIAPVDGWSLLAFREDDSDGFNTAAYVARSADEDVWLHTSRFLFTPTQERFAFLVRSGFARSSNPWCPSWHDGGIDLAIADAARASA